MEELIRFRHNVMNVSAISTFENIKGGINNNCKDVYFVRAVGTNTTYLKEIQKLDDTLLSHMNEGKGYYQRISELSKLQSTEDVSFYSGCYTGWLDSNKKEMKTRATQKNKILSNLLAAACTEIESIYQQENRQITDSMLKNFIVKLLYWYDSIFANENFKWDEKQSLKIVAANIEKKQEYLFFYLITLMGCDVLLLQSRCDISAEEEKLGLSTKFVLGDYSDIAIPQYQWHNTQQSKTQSVPHKIVAASNGSDREKSFEELAQLASSVVLIYVHDDKGEIRGSGSGIMIGEDGYILTNHHVVCGGKYYSVRIENDNQEYRTDEIIKYHSVLDLAIMRIQRKLNPIPIYHGTKELVRGQKVVAIGSPLGLFNSVSDGIISGFRQIDNVDMIQFTAPTSQGSSGGAVLNMQGEVIGISTAGIDSGQNINLAMGYECINMFIKGFI